MLMGQLRALGVQPGGVLLVHTALSRVGTSPYQLIEGLLAAVGADGTLVMPSMADDDDVPFDRKTTPCRAVGVVADTFWRMAGVLRSDSPHSPRASPNPIRSISRMASTARRDGFTN